MTGLIEPIADPELTPREAVATPSPAPPPPAATAEAPSSAATERGVARRPSIEAELVATLTADDGTLHPLLEETSTIGRTAANTIALRDASVSAKHALVVRSAEGFVIEDVGSRNGTYVNSEKLTEKRLLADGDLVRLGKIILTFNLAADIQKKQSTEREMMK
jgi:pSer/pThr/pTyr-binding forkhead associated (FHA) protein